MWLFYHQKPRKDALITAGVIFTGIVCFFIGKLTLSGWLGNLIAIFSGLAYTGVFMMKKMRGSSFESSMIFSFLITVVISIPSIAKETDFSLPVLFCMLILGTVQYGLSYIFLSRGLDHVSPVSASLISTIEPILNPLFVAMATGERIGVFAVIGSVLVLGASAFYNISSFRAREAGS